MNHKSLADKLGVNFETIKRNKFDDIFTSTRKASDEEITMMRNSKLDIYSEFTGHVIKERKISENDITKIAEGRVWTGEQALKNKLVDNQTLTAIKRISVNNCNIKNAKLSFFVINAPVYFI